MQKCDYAQGEMNGYSEKIIGTLGALAVSRVWRHFYQSNTSVQRPLVPPLGLRYFPIAVLRVKRTRFLFAMPQPPINQGIPRKIPSTELSRSIWRPFSPCSGSGIARFHTLLSGNCALSLIAAYWPTDFCGCIATSAGRTVSFRSHARGVRCAPPAAAAGWRIRRRIWWTGCFRGLLCGNGCSGCLCVAIPVAYDFRAGAGRSANIHSDDILLIKEAGEGNWGGGGGGGLQFGIGKPVVAA